MPTLPMSPTLTAPVVHAHTAPITVTLPSPSSAPSPVLLIALTLPPSPSPSLPHHPCPHQSCRLHPHCPHHHHPRHLIIRALASPVNHAHAAPITVTLATLSSMPLLVLST